MSWILILWIVVGIEIAVVSIDCVVWYYRTKKVYTSSLQSLMLAPHGWSGGVLLGLSKGMEYNSRLGRVKQYGYMILFWSCLISCFWAWKIGAALVLALFFGRYWFQYPALAKSEIARVKSQIENEENVEEKTGTVSRIHKHLPLTAEQIVKRTHQHRHDSSDNAPPPWMPTPPTAEQTAEYDRQHREFTRTNYIQQLTGSLIITSIQSGKAMTPSDAVKLAHEIADALGM